VKPLPLLTTILGLLALASFARAQGGFISSWEDRARATLAGQPAWPTALVTANSGLVQLFRADFVRQITPAEITTWNYGNSKGLDLVPWYKTEFDITVPPYIEHNSPNIKDGFGDLSMLLKYRILSDNEIHPYSMSVSLGGTIPTGSYTNVRRGRLRQLFTAEKASAGSTCHPPWVWLYQPGSPPNWDGR
jgi:hypothetical protein